MRIHQSCKAGVGPAGVGLTVARGAQLLCALPVLVGLWWAAPGPARADAVASCGGFAMLGGAQINCSHMRPTDPAQVCTFSWTLMTTSNTLSTVEGSFLLPPGANNMTVYQGSGFTTALANPIVLCQGKKSR